MNVTSCAACCMAENMHVKQNCYNYNLSIHVDVLLAHWAFSQSSQLPLLQRRAFQNSFCMNIGHECVIWMSEWIALDQSRAEWRVHYCGEVVFVSKLSGVSQPFDYIRKVRRYYLIPFRKLTSTPHDFFLFFFFPSYQHFPVNCIANWRRQQ